MWMMMMTMMIEVILFDLLLCSLVCALVLLNMVNFKTFGLISSMDKDMAHIHWGKNMGFSLFRYIDKIRATNPIHRVQKYGHWAHFVKWRNLSFFVNKMILTQNLFHFISKIILMWQELSTGLHSRRIDETTHKRG